MRSALLSSRAAPGGPSEQPCAGPHRDGLLAGQRDDPIAERLEAVAARDGLGLRDVVVPFLRCARCQVEVLQSVGVQYRVVRPFPRSLRGVLWMLAGASGAMLLIGIPTDVVPNPWFTRMTPVRPLDEIFLGANAAVFGLLTASVAVRRAGSPIKLARAGGGGVLAWFAIGCPICNKVVVALLGVSGALTWFAPLQPILGAVGLGFAVSALVIERRRVPTCRSDDLVAR